MTYRTLKHPATGAIYAVEIDEAGNIHRAAGPIEGEVPLDPQAVQDYLFNHLDDDPESLARELSAALAR